MLVTNSINRSSASRLLFLIPLAFVCLALSPAVFANGDDDDRGPTGPTGPKGATGATGATGAHGVARRKRRDRRNWQHCGNLRKVLGQFADCQSAWLTTQDYALHVKSSTFVR
jgi:hypothetical protein